MRILMIFLILSSSVLSQEISIGFDWGTSKLEIEKTYTLDKFKNPLLEKSKRRFLNDKYAQDFSLYIILEDEKASSPVIENYNLLRMVGFYKDSLIYVIWISDQFEYSRANSDTLSYYFEKKFIPNEIQLGWRPVFRSDLEDGTIFNDGGMAATGNTKESYYELQLTMGTITNPTHIQGTLFHLSRSFFDQLSNSTNYTMDKVLKNSISSYSIFTRYYSEKTIKRMKKYKSNP